MNTSKKLLLTMLLTISIAFVGCGKSEIKISDKPETNPTESIEDAEVTEAVPGEVTVNPVKSDVIVYDNTQYGFEFSLPNTWKGYSIVMDEWEGYPLEDAITENVVGKLIYIRHPEWTSEKPRQDIPIMIFTIEQWNSLQKEEFHIGAAPIGPSELGRNSQYVFALPARYNYAFLTGYEEIETIVEKDSLQPTEAFDINN